MTRRDEHDKQWFNISWNETSVTGNNTSSMTWRLTVPFPECTHPVEEQRVTAEGVECQVCGAVQKPYDDSELDGVDP